MLSYIRYDMVQIRVLLILVLTAMGSLQAQESALNFSESVSRVREVCLSQKSEYATAVKDILYSIDPDSISRSDLFTLKRSCEEAMNFRTRYKYLDSLEALIGRVGIPSTRKQLVQLRSNFEGLFHNRWLINTMRYYGLVEGAYPFRQTNSTEDAIEFDLYHLSSSDTIAEIGAGSGLHGILMKFMYPGITIYLNEIDSSFLNYIQTWVNKSSYSELQGIQLTLGNQLRANIPSGRLSKVLIRNAFHHFEFKEEMLNSIRGHLLPTGSLLIVERFLSQGGHCKKSMKRGQLIKLLRENGFRKINSKRIPAGEIIEFRPTS